MVTDNLSLDQRVERALSLRSKGYNCAQCVAMAFNPQLEAVTAGLGTGVAATGHICGAVSAMAVVASSLTYAGPAAKQELYGSIRNHIEQFESLNQGDSDCRDLRKPGRKPCVDLIVDAVTILHRAYAEAAD